MSPTCDCIYQYIHSPDTFCEQSTIIWKHISNLTSLVAQMVKNLLAGQETWVWLLSWEDPLDKGMATHSSIPAWRIPWTEKPGGLQSMGSQRVRHDWATNISLHFIYDIYIHVCWPLWAMLQWTLGCIFFSNYCFHFFGYIPRRCAYI